jgi:hypothetical protein
MLAPIAKNKNAAPLSLQASLSGLLIIVKPHNICPASSGMKAKSVFVVLEISSQL